MYICIFISIYIYIYVYSNICIYLRIYAIYTSIYICLFYTHVQCLSSPPLVAAVLIASNKTTADMDGAIPRMTLTTDSGLSIRVSMFEYVRLVTGTSSRRATSGGSHRAPLAISQSH